MDLKKDYEKIYQHWLNEFRQTNLTQLNRDLFDQYTTLLKSIENHKEVESDILKSKMVEIYKSNIRFIYEDLLKIRELKIINSALALKEINTDNVIEAEKLLYQNLISSIKGYRKVKAISIFEGEEGIKPEEITKPAEQVVSETDKLESSISKEEPEISEIIVKQNKEEVDFIILKFLKKTPPLVGIDLINYGPFEVGDLASIPSQNAKILLLEKFAEKVDVT
ncbi:MAG: hypothetical protein ACFE8B_07075 [Candidatus Hermodarchaeota archaeon]